MKLLKNSPGRGFMNGRGLFITVCLSSCFTAIVQGAVYNRGIQFENGGYAVISALRENVFGRKVTAAYLLSGSERPESFTVVYHEERGDLAFGGLDEETASPIVYKIFVGDRKRSIIRHYSKENIINEGDYTFFLLAYRAMQKEDVRRINGPLKEEELRKIMAS